MDDSDFKKLESRKYGHIVIKVLSELDSGCIGFGELRDEVNAIVTDDSRGAKELNRDGEYSPAALSSWLSEAEDAGLVNQVLIDGTKCWSPTQSALSKSQSKTVEFHNDPATNHMDNGTQDFHF